MKQVKYIVGKIKQLPRAHYEITMPWDMLEESIERDIRELGLDLSPDFQRAHVWTKTQQSAYVEYILQGGEVGRNITFNHPDWMGKMEGGPYVIVDGKQRLEAVRSFLRNDFKAFGNFFNEFEDRLSIMIASFNWRVCCLKTRAELLQLYLNINAGGTPHTKAELDKVRKMLKKEKQ